MIAHDSQTEGESKQAGPVPAVTERSFCLRPPPVPALTADERGVARSLRAPVPRHRPAGALSSKNGNIG